MVERERLKEIGVVELILLGDCACAFGDAAGLEGVCQTVAALGGEVAERALAASHWAGRDLVVATALWEEVASALRRERTPKRALGSRRRALDPLERGREVR